MNKFKIITISFLVAIALFPSCNNADSSSGTTKTTKTKGTTIQSGTYKLVLDGNIVAEGTSTEKVLMFDNTINMGGASSDFVITITNVPETIGDNIAIDLSSGTNGDGCQLSISANNMLESGADESYWGKSGTVTRTSASKISFEVTCQTDASGTVLYTFNGNIESDAFKVN
jgi:hypothetical protein